MKIMVREGSSAKNMEALFDFNKRLDYWKNQDNFGTLPNEILEKKNKLTNLRLHHNRRQTPKRPYKRIFR